MQGEKIILKAGASKPLQPQESPGPLMTADICRSKPEGFLLDPIGEKFDLPSMMAGKPAGRFLRWLIWARPLLP